MKHQAEVSESQAGSRALEEELFRVLLERGTIIPESVDEVARALEVMAEEGLEEGPVNILTPLQALERLRKGADDSASKIVHMPPNAFASVKEEMRRAARKGAAFSEAVEARMRANREKIKK